MSAQVADVFMMELGRAVARQVVWVGPEGDESGWVMARAERCARGVLVDVPRGARLCGVAALRGRAVLMTQDGAAWVEQPCASVVDREHPDGVAVLLIPDGPARRVEPELGGVPRT